MMLRRLRSSAGITYIGAIVMVVILGIMASRAAIVWKTSLQREKEAELLFRGMQYMDALRRWYWPPPKGVPGYVPAVVAGFSSAITGNAGAAPGGAAVTTALPASVPNNVPSPKELKDLLTGSEAGKKPYLRRLFLDPMTGKEFQVIRDVNQKIIGVASTSEQEPIKQGDFPFELDPGDFEHKKKYSDWQFVCIHWPKPVSAGGQVKGLETTGPGGQRTTAQPREPQPQPPPVPSP